MNDPAKQYTQIDLRALRKAAGLTQTEAGKLVGVPLRTWQTWERGAQKPPLAARELFALKISALAEMKAEWEKAEEKDAAEKDAASARQYILARVKEVGASVINDASIATSGLKVAKIKKDGSLLLNVPASRREATDAELCAIADRDAERALSSSARNDNR